MRIVNNAGRRGASLRGRLIAVLLISSAGLIPAPARGSDLSPDQVAGLLASMHPDYTHYIHEIRYGESRLRPLSIYAGLVRPGGTDPRNADDGPRAGRGAVNDLIVYADTFEPWRTPAWRLMIADHEYFHARHLAKGFDLPLVGFGNPRVDSNYLEAMAWEYVVRRADEGIYGELSRTERAEARLRYEDHYAAFRQYVFATQPSAWAHYGRFLPDPATRVTTAGSARTEALPPEADGGTR